MRPIVKLQPGGGDAREQQAAAAATGGSRKHCRGDEGGGGGGGRAGCAPAEVECGGAGVCVAGDGAGEGDGRGAAASEGGAAAGESAGCSAAGGDQDQRHIARGQGHYPQSWSSCAGIKIATRCRCLSSCPCPTLPLVYTVVFPMAALVHSGRYPAANKHVVSALLVSTLPLPTSLTPAPPPPPPFPPPPSLPPGSVTRASPTPALTFTTSKRSLLKMALRPLTLTPSVKLLQATQLMLK
jgi:hypothetical protein